MTPAAVPRRRAALYALLALALLGANAWRLAGREDGPDPAGPGARTEALAELPDLEATASLRGFGEPQPIRDLFRRDAPPEPKPEPDLAPRAPEPPPDPTVQAVAEARETLDAIALRGLLGGGAGGRMAVVEHGGASRTVVVGETVIPGYTVSAIDAEGLIIRHDELGILQTYHLE